MLSASSFEICNERNDIQGGLLHGDVSTFTPGHFVPLHERERWTIELPQVTGQADQGDHVDQPADFDAQLGDGAQARAWLIAFLLKKWLK